MYRTEHVDPASRPAPREILRENVERARHDETDTRKPPYLDMLGNLLADREVLACQVEAGLTGNGMNTERHDKHVLGLDGSQGPPANLARFEHGQRVSEVESLPLGMTLGTVIDRHSRGESVTDDSPGARRPHVARADNPDIRHDARTKRIHRVSHGMRVTSSLERSRFPRARVSPSSRSRCSAL
jgi:hypothetical protein